MSKTFPYLTCPAAISRNLPVCPRWSLHGAGPSRFPGRASPQVRRRSKFFLPLYHLASHFILKALAREAAVVTFRSI